MERWKILVGVIVGIIVFSSVLVVAQQTAYDWMPKGGQELLLRVVDNCENCDDLATLVTTERSEEEWTEYFTNQESTKEDLTEEQKKKGAFAGFSESQMETLAVYLANRFPVSKKKQEQLEETEEIDWLSFLPPDGNSLVSINCSLCHVIGVPAKSDKTRDGWHRLFTDDPDHVIIDATEKERVIMSVYMANNFPVPEEELPEELQGALPGY